MGLLDKSDYALYSYSLNGGKTLRELSKQLTELTMTTIAPGGYGDLKCRWLVKDRRIIPADYAIFNRVALMEGRQAIWLGRWDEPAVVLDEQLGDVYEASAQGAANCLQDDPEDASYTTQTALQILTDQFQGATLGRANFLPIDADLSLLLADNPSATYTYAPQGRNIEEVLNEVIPMCGNYNWQVQAHGINKDMQGFPTWQIATTKLTTGYLNTVHYTAQLTHLTNENELRPSAEFCYNAIQVKYRNSGNSGYPASVTVQDGRLNGNKSQGAAPFPYRKLIKDLSSYQMSTAQATTIANALLASYQNGGFKVTFKVAAVNDASGHPVPLWRVQAGYNIHFPELTPAGSQIVLTPTQNVNLFYITETQYQEQQGQTPTLEVTAVSFQDKAAYMIARLQYQANTKSRTKRTHGVQQGVGEVERGAVATSWPAAAVTTDSFEEGVNFKTTMTNTPSSITLTANNASNANTPTTTNISATGFSFLVQPTANGAGHWRGVYTTQGN